MNLTPTMQEAVEYARQHGGALIREPGGFWVRRDETKLWGKSFGTPTVQALVARGLAEYTEWKDGRNGRFPVRMQLKDSPLHQQRRKGRE